MIDSIEELLHYLLLKNKKNCFTVDLNYHQNRSLFPRFALASFLPSKIADRHLSAQSLNKLRTLILYVLLIEGIKDYSI